MPGDIERKGSATQGLGERRRHLPRRTVCQILEDGRGVLARLVAAEGTDGGRLNGVIWRARQLYEQLRVRLERDAQGVDRGGVQIVWQIQPAILRDHDGQQEVLVRADGLAPGTVAGAEALPCEAYEHQSDSVGQGSSPDRDLRRDYFLRPEYSSIWAVKSSGYEILTSMMRPSLDLIGSSFGCTNPV